MDILKNYFSGNVEGKNILITGGTTGIGRAAAILLSSIGANVLIVGRNEQHLNDAIKDIAKTAKGNVHSIIADLSTEKGIENVFRKADSHFDKLDVLINNAALPFGNTSDGNYKDWEYLVNTNFLAYLACCDAAVKRMKNEGHIINVGSMSADVREGSGSVYVATKSGIQGFSESLRKQINKEGIKVTLLEPGAVDTDMQEESTEKKKQKVDDLEMLTADDIAFSILYCLSQPKRCDVVEMKIKPHRQFI